MANTNRPERRTALVCKELARFNIDVAALSETRLPEEGNISEAATGYTIFWKGKAPEEPRIHGVGFAIRSQLVKQHNIAPTAINERLMTVRIPITRGRYITLILVAYCSNPDLTRRSQSCILHRARPHHPESTHQ